MILPYKEFFLLQSKKIILDNYVKNCLSSWFLTKNNWLINTFYIALLFKDRYGFDFRKCFIQCYKHRCRSLISIISCFEIVSANSSQQDAVLCLGDWNTQLSCFTEQLSKQEYENELVPLGLQWENCKHKICFYLGLLSLWW